MPDNVTLWILAKDLASRVITSITGRLRGGLTAAAEKAGRALGRMAGILATAVLGSLVAATRAAAAFEQRMAEVGTLLSGESTKAVEGLSEQILALSKRLPKTADDLGSGLYQVLSAGIQDTGDAFRVLEVAAKAGVAGITDTNTSVTALTAVMNAYGLTAQDAERVTDVFFQTVKDGVITFPELAQNIGEVANSAALAGVSLESLGAAIATMTKRGVNAAETVTSLNRILLSIVSPQQDAADAARQLGVDWSVTHLRAVGLVGIMQELQEATGGNVEVLNQIVPDIRSFRAAAVLAGTGAADFRTEMERMRGSTGTTEEAFNKMRGTAANLWQLWKNKLNVVLIEAGSKLLPSLKQALEEAGNPLDTLRRLVQENQQGLAAFGEALGHLGTFIANAIGWIGRLTVRLGALAEAWNQIIDPSRKFADPMIDAIRRVDLQGEQGIKTLSILQATIEKRRRELSTQITAAEQAVDEAARTISQGREQDDQRRLQELSKLQSGLDELTAEYEGLGRALQVARQRFLENNAAMAQAANLARQTREDLNAPAGGTARVDPLAHLQAQADAALARLRLAERNAILAPAEQQAAAEQKLLDVKARTRQELIAIAAAMEQTTAPAVQLTAALDGIAKAVAAIDQPAQSLEQRLTTILGPAHVQGVAALEHGLRAMADAEREVLLARNPDDQAAAERRLKQEREGLRAQLVTLASALLVLRDAGTDVADVLAEIDRLLGNLGAAAQSTADQFHAAWSEAIGDIASRFAHDFGDAVAGAFKAAVDGSKSMGEAFKEGMLGALASVARGFGEFFIAQAVASVASIFGPVPNPGGAAAAAKWTAAAAAMFAIAGTLEGIASGGGGTSGGGGGGTSTFAGNQQLQGQAKGDAYIVLEGSDLLDMGDPRNEQRLVEAFEQLSGRRVHIRRRQSTRNLGG